MKSVLKSIYDRVRRRRSGTDLFFDQVISSAAGKPAIVETSKESLDAGQAYELSQSEAVWNISEFLADDVEIQAMVADCQRDLQLNRSRKKLIQFPAFGPMVMASVVGFAVLLSAILIFDQSQHYSTGLGEQRSFVLDDGSSLLLNTDSKVVVKFNDASRDVFVERGEVFFDVVKDLDRDFTVKARNGVTRVVGTRFNVDLRETDVIVTVVSGVVEVISDIKTEGEAHESMLQEAKSVLTKGQSVAYDKKQAEHRLVSADLGRINAWRNGMLVFEGVPLHRAVHEHNRYAKQKLILVGDELRDIRVTGNFKVGDTDGFVFALENMFEISVFRDKNQIAISKTRPDFKTL